MSNSLYEGLDTAYRESTISIISDDFKLQTISNKMNPTKYNIGGNIDLKCQLPLNQDPPNYINLILNVAHSNDLIHILTDFLVNADFLTKYVYSASMKSSNNVPLIDLSSALNKPELCWNWNIGRDYTSTTILRIKNYYSEIFNKLIDHIITNDVKQVDATFSALFVSLFCNSEGNIFKHANGTLVLPSLVNWIATQNGTYHALDYCGFVKAGSQIFPVDNAVDWKNVIKWSDESSSCSPIVNVPIEINQLISRSSYSYPFITNNQTPSVVDTPLTSYRSNIPSVDITDNYPYSTHKEYLNNFNYATQYTGTKKIITKHTRQTTTVKLTATVPFKSIADTNDVTLVTSCTTSTNNWGKKCGFLCAGDQKNQSWTTATANGEKIIVYTPKKAETISNDVLKSAIPSDKYPNFKIINIVNKAYEGLSGSKFIENSLMSKSVYNISSANKTLTWCLCRFDENVIESKCVPSSMSSLGYQTIPDTVRMSFNVELEFDVDVQVNQYLGSLNVPISGTSASDTTPIYDDKSICLYKTNSDLYFFGKTTFDSWVSAIKNSDNQQLILNEIRNYLGIEHVMLNKVNRAVGDYCRSLGKTTSFFNNPLGKPIVISNTDILEYKGFIPTSTFDSVISDKFSKEKLNMNVIGSISCDASGNYLDYMFHNIINESKYNGLLDSTFAYYVILPTRGYQLFDVVSSTSTFITSGLLSDFDSLSNTNGIVYDFNISKILITKSKFESDSKLTLLKTNYTAIHQINIPVMTCEYKDNYIDLHINSTINESNIFYVYVSSDVSQEMISSLRGTGTDKNIDNNGIVNPFMNIQYNGIDTQRTPICLQRHI